MTETRHDHVTARSDDHDTARRDGIDPPPRLDRTPTTGLVFVTMSSEIHIKSSRTRAHFIKLLARNLRAGLTRDFPTAHLETQWDRMYIEDDEPANLDGIARLAARIFGIKRAEIVRRLAATSLEELVVAVAEVARSQVEGKTFAVRVRRRGQQGWRSIDAERLIGAELWPHAAGVNLTAPEVEVRVHAHEETAYVVEQSHEGPDGLPMGAGGRALTLLSGGFDSAAAAWMMMRRGLRIDFLHFLLDCSQSEHALTVNHELCRHWGHGRRSLMHVVDFQPVKDLLLRAVPSRVRQVVLKQLMVAVADRLAARQEYLALVTGDSLGQVSSQTLEHLAAVDRYSTRTVLRPLAGMTKQEIIAWTRLIGTHDLSARAKEVCDLADGPVAVAAKEPELARAHARLPEGIIERALESCKVVVVEDWIPGAPMVQMVTVPPADVPVVGVDGSKPVPRQGPVALFGRRAPYVASRLQKQGRQVWVLLSGPDGSGGAGGSDEKRA